MWKKAHKLYVQAFQEPATEPEKKRLAKLLKKPLPKEVSDTLFDYDAFLRGLGRMSLSKSLPPPPLLGMGLMDRQTSRRTAACMSCTRT